MGKTTDHYITDLQTHLGALKTSLRQIDAVTQEMTGFDQEALDFWNKIRARNEIYKSVLAAALHADEVTMDTLKAFDAFLRAKSTKPNPFQKKSLATAQEFSNKMYKKWKDIEAGLQFARDIREYRSPARSHRRGPALAEKRSLSY